MMTYIWFYLQSNLGDLSGVSGEWLAILGPVGFLLLAALVYQSRELKIERQNNKALNESVRTDGLANMKIVDALMNDIKNQHEHDKMLVSKIDKVLEILHTSHGRNEGGGG